MGDSQLSASELRRRYGPGGSVKDSDLSASQLRARHAIPSNSASASLSAAPGVGCVVGVSAVLLMTAGLCADFSNQRVGGGGGIPTVAVIGIIAVVAAVGLYVLLGS